jgi:DNA-binding NarL/FixJ family response regulator
MRALSANSDRMGRKFIPSTSQTKNDLTVVGEQADSNQAPDLSQLRPELILADTNLGAGDSLDVTRQMKARLPEPRIILFSALRGETYNHAAKKCGADLLVPKGIPILGILGAIR